MLKRTAFITALIFTLAALCAGPALANDSQIRSGTLEGWFTMITFDPCLCGANCQINTGSGDPVLCYLAGDVADLTQFHGRYVSAVVHYVPCMGCPDLAVIDDISIIAEPPSCGDVNCDGMVDIDDVTAMLMWVFLGETPCAPSAGDVNCDGENDIDDVVYIVEYVFMNGPDPCADCP